MSRMSRYFSEHTTAATIFRTSALIAAVIAGASSAASPAAAQSFFERLFGAPEARPEARTPAARKPGDTVIRSRDQSGNPGPAYRVLGVVPKTPKPNLSQGERLKQKIAQDLLKAPPAPPTQGPLLLTVSIAKQTVTLYDGGVAVAKSPVSTGTPGWKRSQRSGTAWPAAMAIMRSNSVKLSTTIVPACRKAAARSAGDLLTPCTSRCARCTPAATAMAISPWPVQSSHSPCCWVHSAMAWQSLAFPE